MIGADGQKNFVHLQTLVGVPTMLWGIYFETWAVLGSFFVVLKSLSLTTNFPTHLTFYTQVNKSVKMVGVGIPDFASSSPVD